MPNSMQQTCPECGAKPNHVHKLTGLLQLPTPNYQWAAVFLYYCDECDWMTIDTWDRTEISPGYVPIYHPLLYGNSAR